MASNASLLIYALVAVVGLVVLIARFKLNAFVALILASLGVGLAAGMELGAIAKAFQDGVGAVLGSIAIVATTCSKWFWIISRRAPASW